MKEKGQERNKRTKRSRLNGFSNAIEPIESIDNVLLKTAWLPPFDTGAALRTKLIRGRTTIRVGTRRASRASGMSPRCSRELGMKNIKKIEKREEHRTHIGKRTSNGSQIVHIQRMAVVVQNRSHSSKFRINKEAGIRKTQPLEKKRKLERQREKERNIAYLVRKRSCSKE